MDCAREAVQRFLEPLDRVYEGRLAEAVAYPLISKAGKKLIKLARFVLQLRPPLLASDWDGEGDAR